MTDAATVCENQKSLIGVQVQFEHPDYEIKHVCATHDHVMNVARLANNVDAIDKAIKKFQISVQSFFEDAIAQKDIVENLIKLDFENCATNNRIYKMLHESLTNGNLAALIEFDSKPNQTSHLNLCFRYSLSLMRNALNKKYKPKFNER